MANTYQSIDIQGAGGSSQPPFTQTFVNASWVLSGGFYELVVPASIHGKGVNVQVQVFEQIDVSNFSEVITDIKVSTIGDVTVIIEQTPDTRFDGKVVIVGE